MTYRTLVLLLAPMLCLADAGDGLAAYKSGDFKVGIPLLKATVTKTSANPTVRAALLFGTRIRGKRREASAAADAAEFPESPEIIAAPGGFAYYLGDMDEAENDFTPVFRYGDHLFVITTVNGKSFGLFLLHTGAGLSSIDSDLPGFQPRFTARVICTS